MVLCIAVNLLRGTPQFDSSIGLETCEPMSWGVLVVFVITCAIMAFRSARRIWYQQALKEKFGKLHESELFLCRKNLPFMLGTAFMSGFIGQIFGLGGGFIYGPMLMSIGVNPNVSASTCLFMVMFSNAASTFMFLLFGRLNLEYTAWVAIFTGTGVLVGLFGMKKLMRTYKRPSLIAFALALACIISTLIALFTSVKNIKGQKDQGLDIMKGDPIC